ncbi:MAG: hypothetical protein COX17_02045 [Deltaproteobacteria bacterium CG23_combo_of_CG06-09_8_20_14_all_60_8]|nr:MAG: hypothetical protein AUK28_09130 [Desulfobacterales bacterium CG2_30_60_27]PIP44327.1 MAG: hypothetical protein COX17_02045 [Deltaproteobacteria bacterium CG23_combo_of_CG06-09_8_20_14_all_60_8]
MACTKKPCNNAIALTSEQKIILSAMAATSSPLACKEIAQAAGLDSKAVSSKMQGLQTMGYIDSPARCRYAITDAGKQVVTNI